MVQINKPKKLTNDVVFLEDQARYIIEVDNTNLSKVEKLLKENDIYYENIGFIQKEFLKLRVS